MFTKIQIFLLFLGIGLASNLYSQETINTDWLIVGAGPAGIITIGILIDLGIDPADITWIDPEFHVGRMGKYYGSVHGNTKTKDFIEFIKNCKIFKECESFTSIRILCSYDPELEYQLDFIIRPLQDITKYLCSKVHNFNCNLTSLNYIDNKWLVGTDTDIKINAKSVVLATGSHPETLNYTGLTEIPLDEALNQAKLVNLVNPEDKILVVGSSHSAILILKYLIELPLNFKVDPVKKVINLYNKPLLYPINMGTWIKNQSTGLSGAAAEWAHNFIEKNMPKNLERLYNSPENIEKAIKECNKVIYACGYVKNSLPEIQQNPNLEYDANGILGPRLFGIGIAFPAHYTDPLNNKEKPIGLSRFLEYAKRVVPIWISKESALETVKKFEKFS